MSCAWLSCGLLIVLLIFYQCNVANGYFFLHKIWKTLLTGGVFMNSFPSLCQATDNTIQQKYDTYSKDYDDLDGGVISEKIGLNAFRRKAGISAKGKILETAVGTGLQLPFYDWSNIAEYTAFDLSEGMLNKASLKLQPIKKVFAKRISLIQGNVNNLPFTARQFDSVIDTFSMCVFDDPKQALREMKRVLSPNGRIILLENSRSTFPPLAWFQDISGGIVAKTAKDCKWNVNVPQLAREVGLHTINYEDKYLGTIMLGIYEIK